MIPSAVEELIYGGIRLANAERGINIPCAPETALFGPESELDSLGLVTVLSQVESDLAQMGHPVNLADDEAIEEVPWRTVATLRDYIVRRLT